MTDHRIAVSAPVSSLPAAAGDRAWLRGLLIGFIAFLTLVDLFAAQAILPSLAAHYGASPAEIGVAANASTLGMAIAGLLVALVARRIDRRRGIWLSLALLAVPTLLLAAAPDLPTFTLLRIAQGLFMAAAFSLTMAYLAERCSAAESASALAAYITGAVASNLVGRLVAASFVELLGLAANFQLFAALNLLGALVAYLGLRAAGPMASDERGSPLASWLRHLRTPRLAASFAIGFLILFAFIGTFTYANFVLAAAPLSLDAMSLGLVYFVFLPSLLTTPFAGRCALALGTRPALWAGLLLALAGLPLLLLGGLEAFLAGLALVGAGTFFAQAVATGFVGRAAERDRAAASGLYLASYYLGGLAGSALLGQVFDRLGWPLAVAGIGLALLLAMLLTLALRLPAEATPSRGRRRLRVVVIGAGFAGLAATRALARAPVEVTLIDRRNYHLFQPLLYQVATAGLSPSQIATPIRALLRRQRNVTVLLGKVEAIDRQQRLVRTAQREIAYDRLIVATGARHAYFGKDSWEAFAPGLKKIEDALAIRHQVLEAFERAEASDDEAERRSLLTFVVIGGGPTGVELAGAIAELARRTLAKDFRRIDTRTTRVLLVEAGPRLLPSFQPALSLAASRQLAALGVEVCLGAPITASDERQVVIGAGRVVACHTRLWAAGVAASPAARWLGSERDPAGRVPVGADLALPGDPDVFVVGDVTAWRDAQGRPAPGTAPAAKQMGRHVARTIRAGIAGHDAPRPFAYRHCGNLATIGRKAAVAEFGRLRLSGYPAWLLWSLAHIYFLVGFRNRMGVMANWAWSYATFARGARLITDQRP